MFSKSVLYESEKYIILAIIKLKKYLRTSLEPVKYLTLTLSANFEPSVCTRNWDSVCTSTTLRGFYDSAGFCSKSLAGVHVGDI